MYGVQAYHLIMAYYGFWLPNDPRGAWSDFVRSWEIFLAGGAATKTELSRCGLHPFASTPYSNGKLPTPCARHQWACYLNNVSDIQRAIRYVENNPLNEGLPIQCWPFVTPYFG